MLQAVDIPIPNNSCNVLYPQPAANRKSAMLQFYSQLILAEIAKKKKNSHMSHLLPPFLFGVAGLAETFPSFSVSGPFLPDVPGFQVPSDSIVPPQLWSSSRALPLHLHFNNSSYAFSFISSFDVPEPFQHSPHNRRYRFHLCFFQDLLSEIMVRNCSLNNRSTISSILESLIH